MISKQGITLTMLTVTLIVLAILGTTITVSIHSTINHSRLTTWANELSNIQSIVDEELKLNSGVPTLNDIVLNVSDFTQEEIDEQFESEILTADKTIALRVLDLGKLKITDTIYGNLETSNDVYAMSTTTGRVYYVKGLKSSGKTYFSLTDELKTMYELDSVNVSIDTIVYKPNIVGYTNQPIIITAYIPEDYTNIQIITTNNDIRIGEALLNNGKYEYVINTNNVTGNYTITTMYTKDGVNETSTYEVNTYDNTKPVISEISKETDVVVEDYIAYIQNLKAIDENGIKYFKYESQEIIDSDAKEYFSTNGNNIVNGRLNLNSNIYTLYVEDKAGNYIVKYVYKLDYVDSPWVKAWSKDGVPIPKGFVESPYAEDEANGIKAENTKDGGFVIYELQGTEKEIPSSETYYKSLTSRNQYVWIPVDKNKFKESFVRTDFINNPSQLSINIAEVDKYWEPISSTKATIENLKYFTKETLAEIQEMYLSVRSYGGFYIARYEAGIDTQRKASTDEHTEVSGIYSMLGKKPYTYISWQDAVEISREIYNVTNINCGVISTLVYGVQWDRTLDWWQETNATDIYGKEVDIKNGTAYSNYYGDTLTASDFEDDSEFAAYINSTLTDFDTVKTTTTKPSTTAWLITTGSLKKTKVNNIYDMSGNVWEHTMESYSTSAHAIRGLSYLSSATAISPAYRSNTGNLLSGGFRIALYIKLPT